MPRTPRVSVRADGLRASTFVAFQRRLRERAEAGALIPLHLGESALLPPPAARGIDLDDAALHRYGPPGGDRDLREAAAGELRRLGLDVEAERVFATPGATGGLDVAVDAAIDGGEEVLVLSPSWPLIRGIVARRGARPVDVPVGEGGGLDVSPAELADRLAARVGPQTAGVYLCDPNNPAGFAYDEDHLGAVGRVALEHGLWLFVDAVYADLVFGGERTRPLAFAGGELAERTFVVLSWSKALGLAGHRVGCLAAPPAVAELVPRVLTHSTYHTSRMGQRMVRAALADPDAAEDRRRRRDAARRGAELTAEGLPGVRFPAPAAGTFAFLDLRDRCADEAAALDLLGRCLDAGVSLAPGSAFGAGYERFARLCFTAVDEDALREGLARVARVMDGSRRAT